MPNWVSEDELRDVPNEAEIAAIDERSKRWRQEKEEYLARLHKLDEEEVWGPGP